MPAFRLTPTVANKRALADECVRLAQRRVNPGGCISALDALRGGNPDFQSGDSHMLYARSLEAQSRGAEALSHYFGGEEPKVRRAQLLERMGDIQAAQDAFAEIKRSVERARTFYWRNQQEWCRLAKQSLNP